MEDLFLHGGLLILAVKGREEGALNFLDILRTLWLDLLEGEDWPCVVWSRSAATERTKRRKGGGER